MKRNTITAQEFMAHTEDSLYNLFNPQVDRKKKEVDIIYYNSTYNDYLHNQILVKDLPLLISQILGNGKNVLVLEVPSNLKDSQDVNS